MNNKHERKKSKNERNFELSGELRKSRSLDFAIDDTAFQITQQTWVFGELRLGARAVVRGHIDSSGQHIALKVSVKQTSPSVFLLEGPLERGRDSDYAIDGTDFVVDGDTWVFGSPEVGEWSVVRGKFRGDGSPWAEQLVIERVRFLKSSRAKAI